MLIMHINLFAYVSNFKIYNIIFFTKLTITIQKIYYMLNLIVCKRRLHDIILVI